MTHVWKRGLHAHGNVSRYQLVIFMITLFPLAVDPSVLQFLSTISPSKVKCKHPACGEMAFSHERSFIHGRNLVTVSSSHLDFYEYLDASFAWIWSDSPHSDACVKVPSSALHLSLSHFLLLLLQTRCVADIEMRRIFSFHIKQRDILVSFRMEGCSLYSLCAPSSMQEDTRQQYLWLRDECKSLEMVRFNYSGLAPVSVNNLQPDDQFQISFDRSSINSLKTSRW